MPNRPPVEFSKGRGGGFSINSRLGIRSCNSSLFKWSLSPGHVPFAILAGGEGSGRRIQSCNSSLFKWSLSPGHVPFAILAGGEGSGRQSYAGGYLKLD